MQRQELIRKDVGFGAFGPAEQSRWDQMVTQMIGPAALPEGTVIYEGLKDNGEIGRDDRLGFWRWVRKALQGPQMMTKGYLDSTAAIVHTTTDQEIIDTTRKECPLMELLPQETARGKVASYDILTARGSSAFGSETIAQQTPPSDSYGTGTKAVKIALSWGGWTDFGLAAMGSQYPSRDARALEIRNKTWSLNELWENELINGSSPQGASALGFVGYRAEIKTSQTANLLNFDMAGADIVPADINKAVAKGSQLNVKYNLMLTDLETWMNLKEMMMPLVRYMNPETEIAWGLKALAWNAPYGVIPIVASKFMNYTAAARELLFLDTKFCAQRMLLDSTMEMLAKVSIQQPFVIKKFAVPIDKTQAFEQTYNNNDWPATTNGTSKMARLYNVA